jgi:hypothetical protein
MLHPAQGGLIPPAGGSFTVRLTFSGLTPGRPIQLDDVEVSQALSLNNTKCRSMVVVVMHHLLRQKYHRKGYSSCMHNGAVGWRCT